MSSNEHFDKSNSPWNFQGDYSYHSNQRSEHVVTEWNERWTGLGRTAAFRLVQIVPRWRETNSAHKNMPLVINSGWVCTGEPGKRLWIIKFTGASFSRTRLLNFQGRTAFFLCCHTWTQHDRKLAAPKCFIGNLDLFVASLARVRLLLRKWALRRNKVVAPYWSIVKLVLCSGYFPKELRQNVEHLFLSKNSASVVYLRRIVAPPATLTVTVDIQ